jgi:hypothetical protein
MPQGTLLAKRPNQIKFVVREGACPMPDNCDPAVYRYRAKGWRERAAALPEDNAERAVCVELAEGYERLAALLEQRESVQSTQESRLRPGAGSFLLGADPGDARSQAGRG